MPRLVQVSRHYCFFTTGVGRHALGTPSRCAFLQTSGASLTTSVAGESQTLRRKGTQFRTRLLMLNTSSRRYTSSICFDRPFYGRKVAQFLASERPAGLEGLVLVAPATPTPQNIPEPAKRHSCMPTIIAPRMLFRRWRFSPHFLQATRCRSKSFPTTSPAHLKRSSPGRHLQRTRTFQPL